MNKTYQAECVQCGEAKPICCDDGCTEDFVLHYNGYCVDCCDCWDSTLRRARQLAYGAYERMDCES